jgi:hypothetical protein
MKDQNYSNHKRYVIGYHFVLLSLSIIALVSAFYFLARSYQNQIERTASTIILLISINFLILYFYSRSFAVGAQDRAIRAEENLRHFVLTGKLLDPRLTISQIIALRFAPDLEFLELVNRAVAENLSNSDIKKTIKQWKPDYHRI